MRMNSMGSSSSLKDFFIVIGLLLVQGVYGGYTIFINHVLALGFDPLFMIVAGSFAGGIFLLPFAIVMERKNWPKKITTTMIVQFGVLALGGVTMFQGLVLMGMKRTNPTIASAMPNLVPGFVFIIAACLRFERFSTRCKYSRAKVLGTIVCLAGAIAMSFLQSPPPSASRTFYTLNELGVDHGSDDWIVGCFYLLAAIICLSSTVVLQAATMVSFPAPFSLCVITALMGSILTGILQIIIQGKIDVGSPNLSIPFVLAVVVGGSVISSTCVVYQTWCVNKKGPLLVTIFSPIQTVFVSVVSAILLGQPISFVSSIGMLLMFLGLHAVLWAKRRECVEPEGSRESNVPHDVEKPLLS
ncbi:WAT1-related protein [Apostasia shenzhenica]|uniref:WAT1-related protein n=1 Tax=Apostasia shenzhenica TaxID=1088818 RepID=A0A2I0AYP8_9ASPA|nr:WAT1-related protein [Apostasia shenzhenica]